MQAPQRRTASARLPPRERGAPPDAPRSRPRPGEPGQASARWDRPPGGRRDAPQGRSAPSGAEQGGRPAKVARVEAAAQRGAPGAGLMSDFSRALDDSLHRLEGMAAEALDAGVSVRAPAAADRDYLPHGDPDTKRGPRGTSSRFRGVTRHRRTQRWEAHIWDAKKQVYLGGYDNEDHAGKAHDVMALKCRGGDSPLNFAMAEYAELLPMLAKLSKEEVVLLLRRQSKGFTRDASKQRAVVMSGAGARAEQRGHTPAPAPSSAAEPDEERRPASPGGAPAPVAAAAGAPWRTRSMRAGPPRGASPAPPADQSQSSPEMLPLHGAAAGAPSSAALLEALCAAQAGHGAPHARAGYYMSDQGAAYHDHLGAAAGRQSADASPGSSTGGGTHGAPAGALAGPASAAPAAAGVEALFQAPALLSSAYQGDTAQWPWQSAALSLAPLTLPYLSNPQLAAVLGYAPALDGGGPAYGGAFYGDEGPYGHSDEGAAAELGTVAPARAGAGGSSSSENCRFRAEAAAGGGAGR